MNIGQKPNYYFGIIMSLIFIVWGYYYALLNNSISPPYFYGFISSLILYWALFFFWAKKERNKAQLLSGVFLVIWGILLMIRSITNEGLNYSISIFNIFLIGYGVYMVVKSKQKANP
jgi:drug/metabolite transporter (DMT)-like permease